MLFTAALALVLLFFIVRDFSGLRRTISAGFLIQGLKVERQKVKTKAMMITINHYRPDLEHWKEIFDAQRPPEPRFLKDNVQYYQTILDYIGDIPDARHALAVSHYFLGDKDRALEYEQKSADLEPHFFWPWHNLGVMYYEKGQYFKSAEAFRRALNAPPAGVARILRSSKIYSEIVRGAGSAKALDPGRIQEGYRNAVRFLEASVRRLRGQPSGIDEKEMKVKVF